MPVSEVEAGPKMPSDEAEGQSPDVETPPRTRLPRDLFVPSFDFQIQAAGHIRPRGPSQNGFKMWFR